MDEAAVVNPAVDIAVRCSIGIGHEKGGRAQNQDDYLVAQKGPPLSRSEDTDPGSGDTVGHGILVAVADGMGGHDHGDLASAAAVRALARLWRKERPSDPEALLREWVPLAHRRIRTHWSPDGGRVNMGTTLTALWLVGGNAGWVHVGDSRLYRRRGPQVHQISRDQTHAEFARRDHREPGPNASYPAQSFIFGSRGLGDDRALRLDPGLDCSSLLLARGDRFLLCSDGVSGFVSPGILRRILCHAGSAGEASADLLEAAVEGGSDDNLTALVIDVLELPRSDAPSTWEGDDTLVPLD